jgi:hypothetical protein
LVFLQDINKIADAIGPSVAAKKGLRTLLHRTNSGYYPFLFGNIYQVTAAAKIVDELLPGQTIAIEMAVKAGKKTQYTDIVVMSGNSIVKRYEVKRWGSTVEGDPDAAEKLSAQLLRHAAGKTNDLQDFQYIVPNLLHAQRIVDGLSDEAIKAFKGAFGADIAIEETVGAAVVRHVNPDFFKVVE